MEIIYIFISSLFFLWVIRNIFFWLTLWQINEYRPDRFFAELNRKKQKAAIFYAPVVIYKLLLIVSFAVIVVQDSYAVYYEYAVILLYLIQGFFIGKEIYTNTLKKPKLTTRAIVIVLLSLINAILLYELQLMDKYFWLVLIDLLIPFIVGLYVTILSFPIELYGDLQIERAMKKLKKNRDILIIGVTGSYGKSFVKDTIYNVLSYKYKVMRTLDADNTIVGIAKTVNEQLESDTEIFVAEMSAYKRGEIEAICKYIKPRIGVLTGVNNHYLPVFKTMDNIIKTNNELVESLPKTGLCLFNGDNAYTQKLYIKSKKRKALYSTVDSKKPIIEGEIQAYKIQHKGKQISFDIMLQDKRMHFVVPVMEHIEIILPAIYLANYLGMTETEIQKTLKRLK